MRKDLFFIFGLIFLINFSSCLELSVSPSEIYFIGEEGNLVCQDLKVQGFNETLVVSDRWAYSGVYEKILGLHNLSSYDLGIDLGYLKKVEAVGNDSFEVCLSGSDAGKFHGVLLFRVKDKPAGIGIWINVEILEKEDRGLSLTGFIVNKSENVGLESWLGLIIVVLSGVLFTLIKKFGKRKSKICPSSK